MDDLIAMGEDMEGEIPKELLRPLAMPIEMQRTYFASVAKILRNPSLAYRKDRHLMKQMRNDPDCMGPLLQLQVSIAGLEWQIKPFDARDAEQEEIAERTAEVIARIPRFADMVRHLLDAVWYGSSALNVVYSRMENGLVVPADWLPFHPDTLIVKEDGSPGIKVGPRYYADVEGTGGETQQGFDSRVHLFTDLERRAVVWHRYMVQGPDFDDPYETAYSFMGKGTRDTVWWYWNLKQAVLQNWATFSERYAQGIRVGYYPMAQKGAKEDMEQILRNMVGDVSAVVPRSTPGQKDYEIEILEPAAARAQVFADLCEWLSKNIKELIVGQSATSEAVSTGLGSNVASQHQKTFTRQMRFIADNLAETLTEQLVKEVVDMNWGPQEFYPRFEFSVESPEMEKKLEAVRIFVNELGGTVSEAEVRKMLGLAIPEADEPVLTGKIRDVFPEYEDGDGADEEDGEVLSSKDAFGRMSDEQLRKEAIRRRRRGRKGRKSPTKKGKAKSRNSLPDAVIERHRALLEEGYTESEAWGVAYRMEFGKTAAAGERMDDLIGLGVSAEQAAAIERREAVRGGSSAEDFARDGDGGFKPPESVAANARKALEVRESKPESQRGMTGVGLARARDLSNRASLSEDTVRRMARYFDRHQSDKQGDTWDEKGKGWQAWNGWGGDEGWAWAKAIVKRLDGEGGG